jgi:hypothetical protein
MDQIPPKLSRSGKLLLFLHEKGKGKSLKMRYEDIVVGAFKKYPRDFQLKGYPEYPDAGDIHKRLYEAKKDGYLHAVNKVFALTDSGLEYAKRLLEKGVQDPESGNRFSHTTEVELARIKGLEGFQLFLQEKTDKLTDNDLYTYLGVTVRTPQSAFIRRLRTLESVQEDLLQRSDALSVKVVQYHTLLMTQKHDLLSSITP